MKQEHPECRSSSSMPLVSIVVAVRNAEKTIDRTLRSILDQTYNNKEVVLIDGASTDSTCEIVARYGRAIASFISEPDSGIADAYNKGIARARGEWIYFLNADDVFFADTVIAQIFGSGGLDNFELIVGNVVADTGYIFNGRYNWKLVLKNQIHHQAIFYRNELLKKLPYNIQYRRYGHDHEHNIMLWRRGTVAKYIDIPIARWATRGISDSATWTDYREEFSIRRNTLGFFGWPLNVATLLRYLIKRIRTRVRQTKPYCES